jgi:sulfide dehydrogenase cytochrome subunit
MSSFLRATPGRASRRVSLRWPDRHAALGAAILLGSLSAADTGADALLASGCTGCHGPGGVTAGAAIPSVAGLDKIYLARVMVQFKNDERPSTIMGRIAKGYTDSELRTMAKQFGGNPWSSWPEVAGQDGLDEGREIHDRVCAECHEQEGRHQDRDTPRIAGQAPEYLLLSLLQYRDGQGTMKLPQPDKMLKALQPLSDRHLLALSRYYASRP